MGHIGSQRGSLPSSPEKDEIYTKDAAISGTVGLWPALVQLSPSPSPLPQRPLRKGDPALWIRDPPPACPIRHTPAIIPERAPIIYYFQTKTPQAERHMLPDAKLAATSRPKGHWTRTSAPNLEPHAQYCTPLLYDISYTVDAYANIYTYEKS